MFDLDGTLVDTMRAFADLAADVMVEHHGVDRAWARGRYLATSGVPFCKQLELIVPGNPANRAASDDFERRKRAICDRTPMDDETIAALLDIKSFGIKVVLSSNTGQVFVDDFVSRESFAFDLALGFDEPARMAKGRPHVSATCKRLGVATGSIWFVGDSLADSDLARESGLTFIGRLGTFGAGDFERHAPGTRTIGTIQDLVHLLAAPTALSAVG
ncbi:MAG TPA: HAD family hydrolase [Kofleriaceae bacterium]|jgi:phosphoglycolate phosphatase-like HAD superfamily hydrolase|nr:HAD family hydrolase [Kofleriaceae bacterium]